MDEEGDSDGDDEEDDDDDDDIDEDGEESDDDNNEGAAKDKKKAKKKRLKGENGSGGEEEEDEDEDIDGEEDDEVSQNVDDEGTVADINNNNIKNHNAHDDENKTTDNENDDNNNANNNNDDDNDTQVQNDPSRKRKLNSAPTSPSSQTSIQSARKRKRNRRKQIYNYQQVIRSYYSEGTYHGMAASGLLYTMASQLGRCNNDMVWWAVIGLTDQFLHDRIQLLKYHDLVDNFKQEVNRFNHGVAGGGGHNNNSTNDVDDLLGSATLINSTDSMSDIVPAALRRRGIGGNASLAGPSVGSTGSRSADDDTITPEDEFRLYLLRHWNLNESMYHSTYVATNMGIWKEKGRSKLDNMLAKMG